MRVKRTGLDEKQNVLDDHRREGTAVLTLGPVDVVLLIFVMKTDKMHYLSLI
jgi:hypothetical protein